MISQIQLMKSLNEILVFPQQLLYVIIHIVLPSPYFTDGMTMSPISYATFKKFHVKTCCISCLYLHRMCLDSKAVSTFTPVLL